MREVVYDDGTTLVGRVLRVPDVPSGYVSETRTKMKIEPLPPVLSG